MQSDQIPDFYMITGKFSDHKEFESKLNNALQKGNIIVQFRNKSIQDPEEYLALAKIAKDICHRYGAILLLATSSDIYQQFNTDGLHLNSQVLFEYQSRPIPENQLLSVSCHTLEEMKQAEELGANILLLSPVKETSSHPGVPGIGWQQFNQMIAEVKCPVYALGGMQASDLNDAKTADAQGVAAISSFWK